MGFLIFKRRRGLLGELGLRLRSFNLDNLNSFFNLLCLFRIDRRGGLYGRRGFRSWFQVCRHLLYILHMCDYVIYVGQDIG